MRISHRLVLMAAFACVQAQGCCAQDGVADGYYGRSHEPSFSDKYVGAPSLPIPSSAFEAYTARAGLVVASDLPAPITCLSQISVRPPSGKPAGCLYVVRVKGKRNAQEAYVAFYDDRSMIYAVLSYYQYTGL